MQRVSSMPYLKQSQLENTPQTARNVILNPLVAIKQNSIQMNNFKINQNHRINLDLVSQQSQSIQKANTTKSVSFKQQIGNNTGQNFYTNPKFEQSNNNFNHQNRLMKIDDQLNQLSSPSAPQTARTAPSKQQIKFGGNFFSFYNSRPSQERLQISTVASTDKISIQKHLPALKNIQMRSLSSIARLTESQNQALRNELIELDYLCSERDNAITGAKIFQNVDPQKLMKETDKGFKILTARLNKVVYSLGTQKLEHQQDYTFGLRPHSGMYCYIQTHSRETPLYVYVRKQYETSHLVVYYSRSNKNPDYENNQGYSRNQKIVITEYNDPVFQSDYIYLGIFSDTGCTFQISFNFKNDIPFKQFGSPHGKQHKKKKKTLELVKMNPLDFLEEENDPESQQQRKKHHHDYFKNKIQAIISDGRVLQQFMVKIKGIKEKRLKEQFLKKQLSKETQQQQIMRILTQTNNNNNDTSQTIPLWNNTMLDSRLGLNQTKLEFKIQQTLDRKQKLDEDNFKKKIFLMNKREYLRDVKEVETLKAQEYLILVKKSKEWMKFRENQAIKMQQEKMRLSILRIQRMTRRMLKRRGKDIKLRQKQIIQKCISLQGCMIYDQIYSRASRVLLEVIKNTSEKYYLKLRLIKFHLNIQKVQQCIRTSVEKKRAREIAVIQSYSDYIVKLETINQNNTEQPVVSKKKPILPKKVITPPTNLNNQSDQVKLKHFRNYITYKEYQFMLEYFRWTIIYNKKVVRLELLRTLKNRLQEIEKLLNLQDKKLTEFNAYQQLIQLKRPNEPKKQLTRVMSHQDLKPEGLKFTNVWNSIQNLKAIQDENYIQEASQIMNIEPDQIKNIPNETQRKPKLLIVPTQDEMWHLFLRIYNIGDLDVNYL